jgi:predicted nucleic acid-binding protein
VADFAVVNASPLILFARAGCFDLLQTAGKTVIVPESVRSEIYRRGPRDMTVQAMDRVQWVRPEADPHIPISIQSWDLGPGESAVLAYALEHPDAEAVIDDLIARRCAAALNIPVHGTLSLILLAKQRKIIAQARPALERMVQAGMYLSPRLLNEALAIINE